MSEQTAAPVVESAEEPAAGVEAPWDQHRVAISLVRRHSAAAAGVGLIPVAGVDFAALTGVMLNLINRLSQLYDVKFTRQAGLNVVVSLLSGVLPFTFAWATFGALKVIPFLGQIAGSTAMSVNSAAVVYALGMVMVRHFEKGGTLIDFDAPQAKAYFKEKLEEHRRQPVPESAGTAPEAATGKHTTTEAL